VFISAVKVALSHPPLCVPAPVGVSEMEPELLAKARKLALGVGAAAGAFGSLVGVGGGVLIGPVILNTCR
jgi:uncharacterized membrane protein YfcA